MPLQKALNYILIIVFYKKHKQPKNIVEGMCYSLRRNAQRLQSTKYAETDKKLNGI